MSTPKRALHDASINDGLPVAPSLGPAMADMQHAPESASLLDRRALWICLLAVVLAIAAAFLGELLADLIKLITGLCFYGEFSLNHESATHHILGGWVILVPIAGGLVVGLMARFGSKAIRGDGIPEAMEQVLTNESRISPRLTLLKPLSAAIAIGTGGPFGAEGPIIATGGALGSLLGQLFKSTAQERKVLLAVGAAAGLTAIFGTPVAAVLLAIELLLFEYRARSMVPVALGCVAAMAVRVALHGVAPKFAMPDIPAFSRAALGVYVLIGALVGVAAIGVTRAIYAMEDLFERLPVHWMWWPAIGSVAVGLIGWVAPRTLGVGYENIEDILSGNLTLQFMLVLCLLKFISWTVALGSGTSGGTLAPLFTVGGGLGAALGTLFAGMAPALGIDPRIAALIGMAAIFAGASRALLAFTIFAFETTHQTGTLLPLLGGCTAAYMVSCLLMHGTIMTEKIHRHGVRVPEEYGADILSHTLVRQFATRELTALRANETVAAAVARLTEPAGSKQHQGYPVLDTANHLVGVVMRRELFAPQTLPELEVQTILKRTPVVVYDNCSLREAVNHMANHDIGRLPVMARSDPSRVVGILTRSDILKAFRVQQRHAEERRRGLKFPGFHWTRQLAQG